ncbi:MAG TPA: sigma-70 family RNA polymerase sigma factor [Gemmatimonadetes bacterium]|nr:sigma-70 family RNA polymerase sigma factor [Gemmatimonadota bacterium]
MAQSTFRSTHWSVVLGASGTGEVARDALQILCTSYWYPLYAFARRRGHDVDMAQDMTQAFFTNLIETRDFQHADPARGRFRAFLITSFKSFLVNEWKRERTERRGGGRKLISIDTHDAESRFQFEAVESITPEQLYQRDWARALLRHALLRLEEEQQRAGRAEIFAHLRQFLTDSGSGAPYATIARELGITETATRVMVHRSRRRYGELLREEIALTLANRAEVEDEIQGLFEAFQSA